MLIHRQSNACASITFESRAADGPVLIDLENRLDRFTQMMESGEVSFESTTDEAEDIHLIANVMNDQQESNPIERGVSALLAFHNRGAAASGEEDTVVVEEEPEREGYLNIFSKISLPDDVTNLVGKADIERFSAPLINKAMLKDKIEFLERVMGKSGAQANAVTNEIIKDVLSATEYPPHVEGLLQDPEAATAMANELAEYIASLRESGTEE